jgi:hypothetical protein
MAKNILKAMLSEIAQWGRVAKKHGIGNSEIQLTKRAFRVADSALKEFTN